MYVDEQSARPLLSVKRVLSSRNLSGRCRKPSTISLERYLARCHGSSLFAMPKPVLPHPKATLKGG